MNFHGLTASGRDFNGLFPGGGYGIGKGCRRKKIAPAPHIRETGALQ
jgi:hypothetical protein